MGHAPSPRLYVVCCEQLILAGSRETVIGAYFRK